VKIVPVLFILLFFILLSLYRNEIGTIRLFLRLAVLTLLLLFYFQVEINLPWVKKEERATAILIDVSRSMEQRRWKGTIRSIQRDYPDRVIPFAAGIGPGSSRERTNLGGALDRLRLQPKPLILISDGYYNEGPDPIEVSRGYPYPIYPVHLPEESIVDFEVVAIEGPDYPKLGDTAVFFIRCQGKGSTDLMIYLDRRPIRSRKLILTGGIREETLRLRMEKEGIRILEVRLDRSEDEIDTLDNQLRFRFEVVRVKTPLLFLSNLTPDVGIMRRVIEPMEWLEVGFRIRVDGGKELTYGKISDRPEIIILDDIDPDPETKRLVAQASSIIFLLGERSWLPQPVRRRRVENREVVPVFDPEFIRFDLTPPPFTNLIEIGGIDLVPLVKSEDGRVILGYHDLPSQRMIFLLAHPIWSFYRRLVGIGGGPLADQLIRKLIQLASPGMRKKRVKIRPIKKGIRIGDQLTITAGLYAPDLRLSTGARVFFRIEHDTLGEEYIGTEVAPGLYQTTLWPRMAGEYQIIAEADGLYDTVRIMVGGGDPESPHSSANNILLEQIARNTGGRMIGFDEIDSLLESVVEVRGERAWLRFRDPWLILLIIGLLASVWWLRKREGLP